MKHIKRLSKHTKESLLAMLKQSTIEIPLSPNAVTMPYDIKHITSESLNIQKAFDVLELETPEDKIPLIIFGRKNGKVYCSFEIDHFWALCKLTKGIPI